ncbi:universal stress protein, partial [Treponema sp.]|uniref:universal stress protein n=1 Tax=Treponema sp. TaxID=166 RepID=UPI00257DD8CC
NYKAAKENEESKKKQEEQDREKELAPYRAFHEKDAYKNDLKKDGQNYLDYVVNLARTKGVKIEPELREGSVSSEVITAADEFGSDLILVGGHNDPGSYIQGNQTKKSSAVTVRNEIVNYAHCPVLVVHKQDVEELFKIS